MSETNDGGSAFPVLMKVGDVAKSEAGMSLRDWFAGQALAGIASQMSATSVGKIAAGETSVELVGSAAYVIADAMLAAREGGAK